MVTVSGCQNITTWLEKSPVISYTALWQALVLAIHSHHPVTTIIIDKTINQTLNCSIAACLTPTPLEKHPRLHAHKHITHKSQRRRVSTHTDIFCTKGGKKEQSQVTQDPPSKKKISLSLSSFNRLCRFGHVYERAHITTLPCHSNLMTECLKFWGLCEKIRISSCGSVVF